MLDDAAIGGAREFIPSWSKVLVINSGSVTTPFHFISLPQLGQTLMSMAKTLASNPEIALKKDKVGMAIREFMTALKPYMNEETIIIEMRVDRRIGSEEWDTTYRKQAKSGKKKAQLARELGISRETLYQYLKEDSHSTTESSPSTEQKFFVILRLLIDPLTAYALQSHTLFK